MISPLKKILEYTMKVAYFLFPPLFIGSVIALKFRKEEKKAKTLVEALKFSFNFRFMPFTTIIKQGLLLYLFSISPAQNPCEIFRLLKILNAIKPKFILEIGTGRGGTLFLFTRIAEPDAMLISIDLPGWPIGGYPKWKDPLYKSFAKYPTQRIYLMKMNSHNPLTIKDVRKILINFQLDFLFIDGGHEYEDVKKDFEMYSPLVRHSGIIAFHDIVPSPFTGGVPKFWNEIKHKYNYLEIIQDRNQKGRGIGIIYKT